ncbi:hypothetical protein [Solirubrobacter deserti]|uniref:Uncharacterized protein n=1 Tax=Solirubrobacter deserti TaxID=2282478 RepID=A0ABT4RDX3_9ACTN|nr:hypothetical protein [Solirubrobacter deserti]MDA0136740.1 hypothetical protein [Solirubrobacter deserti]
MNAGLSTSPHQYSVPQVREVAPPAKPEAEPRRPLTQRELVAMSLLACPDRGGVAKRI